MLEPALKFKQKQEHKQALSFLHNVFIFFPPYSQIHGLKIKIKKKQNISKPTPSFQKKSPQTPSDCPLIKSSGPLGHELVSLPLTSHGCTLCSEPEGVCVCCTPLNPPPPPICSCPPHSNLPACHLCSFISLYGNVWPAACAAVCCGACWTCACVIMYVSDVMCKRD